MAKGLLGFVTAVEASPELREAVSGASAQEIVALAASAGYLFTLEELRVLSRELAATYWPWAGKGREFRRDYFAGASP